MRETYTRYSVASATPCQTTLAVDAVRDTTRRLVGVVAATVVVDAAVVVVAAALGVTVADAADCEPVLTALTAAILTYTGVPLASPVTRWDEAGPTDSTSNSAFVFALYVLTSYPVTADPPSFIGAVQATDTLPSPATTDVIAGAPGAALGVASPDESWP